MKRLILALALAVPLAAAADDLKCSTKAKKLTSKADMTAMAKVKEADAKKAALDAVKATGATISKGGLEVEDGCLIYSYDVKVPGKSGIEEVIVDAGTGKVLKVEHEGAVSEAAGKAKQKAVEVKDKVKMEAKEVKDKVTGRTPGTDK
jgi:uncharacterized membrane protein YkoI